MESVTVNLRRVLQVGGSMAVTFVALRVFLHTFPEQDFDVGGYNIHHLFTGLILLTLGGIPTVVFQGRSRWLDLAAILFGIGLSMALDEWVYLIVTDGSNASYLVPASFWGGLAFVTGALLYLGVLAWWSGRTPARARDRAT